jgi:LacI family transcriptional regulator, repressor for deo operon, udp, cdd, tsx, nupC, and nupG
MARPTINDVASAAGVSKGAVSFALNDRPGLAPDTRRRILEVAEQLGWSPSPQARALSVSKALAVGLVIARPPDVLRADTFFPSFIAGLETVLSARGQALLLQVAEHGDVEAYRRLASEGRVDGVFVTDLRTDDERPALLDELGLPAVIVGPDLGDGSGYGAQQSVLGVDDAPGIAAAVWHLAGLGHTRIAYIDGGRGTIAADRRRGYRRAMRAHGLDGQLRVIGGDHTEAAGARAARLLLDEGRPLPTGVVAFNDHCAVGLLDALTRAGVEVPGEVSVVGYDDSGLSRLAHVNLTTVNQDARRQATHAVAAATERLDGGRTSAREVVLAPHLVVRGTTGPPPGPAAGGTLGAETIP